MKNKPDHYRNALKPGIESDRVPISARITEDLKAELIKDAKKRKKTLAQLIEDVLKDYVEYIQS